MNKINTHVARVIGLSLLLATSTNFAMSTNEPMTPKKLLQNIKKISSLKQIDECKEHIKEGIADEMIKEYVNLTGLSYNSVKQEINDIQNQVQSALRQPNDYPNHDKNMPQDLQNMALKTLTRNNINPNNIRTYYEKNQNRYAATGTCCPDNTILDKIT
jgi:hypothetical protein